MRWRLRWRGESVVRIEDNTFHIRKGDAVLSGTFLAPAGVKIEKRLRYTSPAFVTVRKNVRSQPYTRDLLTATGPDGTEGEFLLVLTLREGDEPPRVEAVEGRTAARVGELGIHFESDRIRFTDAP